MARNLYDVWSAHGCLPGVAKSYALVIERAATALDTADGGSCTPTRRWRPDRGFGLLYEVWPDSTASLSSSARPSKLRAIAGHRTYDRSTTHPIRRIRKPGASPVSLRLGRVLGLDQLFHCRESSIRRLLALYLLPLRGLLLLLRSLLVGFLSGFLVRSALIATPSALL
jgi:hypothetical protein